MDNQQIANALWGSSPAQQQPAPEAQQEAAPVEVPTAEPTSEGAPAAEVPEQSPADPGAALFGGGGTPEGGVYVEMNDLYESMQAEDRMAGEQIDVEAFKASQASMQQFAVDAGLSRPEMGTLMEAARDALAYPITTEANHQARNERCLAELRTTWGKDFDQNLQTALGEAERLMQAVPEARAILEAGAGSNPQVVKTLAQAARRRQMRRM